MEMLTLHWKVMVQDKIFNLDYRIALGLNLGVKESDKFRLLAEENRINIDN